MAIAIHEEQNEVSEISHDIVCGECSLYVLSRQAGAR